MRHALGHANLAGYVLHWLARSLAWYVGCRLVFQAPLALVVLAAVALVVLVVRRRRV